MTRQLIHADDIAATGHQQSHFKFLTDWGALLREVAQREQLAHVWGLHWANRPTLFWDELVRARVALLGDEKSPERAARAEHALRRRVADLLLESQQQLSSSIDTEKLFTLLMMAGPELVSLNFDTLLTLGEQRLPVAASTAAGAQSGQVHRLEVHGKSFWFPHGCALEPKTIALGLRDYGFHPSHWDRRFRQYKAFEKHARPGAAVSDVQHLDHQIEHLRMAHQAPANVHFMGQLLLAPLIFFGVGLSESEWGWWWLLNQRARNLARIHPRSRPPTIVLRSTNEGDAVFWSARPAGVTSIFVPDWGSGWRVLMDWLDAQRSAVA